MVERAEVRELLKPPWGLMAFVLSHGRAALGLLSAVQFSGRDRRHQAAQPSTSACRPPSSEGPSTAAGLCRVSGRQGPSRTTAEIPGAGQEAWDLGALGLSLCFTSCTMDSEEDICVLHTQPSCASRALVDNTDTAPCLPRTLPARGISALAALTQCDTLGGSNNTDLLSHSQGGQSPRPAYQHQQGWSLPRAWRRRPCPQPLSWLLGLCCHPGCPSGWGSITLISASLFT